MSTVSMDISFLMRRGRGRLFSAGLVWSRPDRREEGVVATPFPARKRISMHVSNGLGPAGGKRSRDLVSAISDIAPEQGFWQSAEAETVEDAVQRDPLGPRVSVAALQRDAHSSRCHEAKKS